MRHHAPLLALLLLAGCAGSETRSHGDAVTDAACRQRAEQVYQMRHPDATYKQDIYTSSLRDSPFSTSGTPSLPTQGLSNQYEMQQLYDDCMRGIGPVGPTPAAPPLAAPASGS